MDEHTELRIRPLGEPGDLGWVVMAHGEVYAEQFGWNAEMEALVARIVAGFATEHDPAREAGWIAEKDGDRVGSVFCMATDDPSVAQLRVLLVTAAARGLGLGSRLVRTCLDFATQAGYPQITLWTNDVLESARRIYEAEGFTLGRRRPAPQLRSGLTGQHWSLRLGSQQSTGRARVAHSGLPGLRSLLGRSLLGRSLLGSCLLGSPSTLAAGFLAAGFLFAAFLAGFFAGLFFADDRGVQLVELLGELLRQLTARHRRTAPDQPTCIWPLVDITVMLRPAPWKIGPSG